MNIDKEGDRERLLRENGLAFFGAITASVSHELNNIISIIDQTGGLLDDLLAGARHGRPVENERLQRIAESIACQVKRGEGVIGHLNTFAHSVDHQVQEFEINQLVGNITELTRRFASLKRVHLETQPFDTPVTLQNNSFLVQQAVFLCIKQLLASAEREDTITVSVEDDRSVVRLLIKAEPSRLKTDDLDLHYLELLTGYIGGTIELRDGSGAVVFELMVPHWRDPDNP